MAKVRLGDQGLSGWTFTIEEVSVGVYKVDGVSIDGRTVGRTGVDERELIRSCVADAAFLEDQHA